MMDLGMMLAAQHDEIGLRVLGRVVTWLPFGKVHQMMDFEVRGRTALFTATTGSPQSGRYRVVPFKGTEILLPVPKAALVRAVFAPALWERAFTVKAGLLGHSAITTARTARAMALPNGIGTPLPITWRLPSILKGISLQKSSGSP